TLSSMTPSSGTRGTVVNVTLTGTNFTPQTTVRLPGEGAAHSNVVVVSPTQITVTFTLSSTAATGAHNVYVVTSTGNSNFLPFTVN
ncbi:MAG: cell surface receptor domain protein, partial [Bryobacterales bacterium]|nr:cell surface receptor domain protein [Bryobacterales bacterium]